MIFFVYIMVLMFPLFINGNEIQPCKPCICEIYKRTSIARCSIARNVTGLNYIPETIDRNINILHFWGESFTILERDTFSTFNNLTEVAFDKNKIETIEQDTFRNLTKLTKLDLSANKLNDLPDKIFSGLQEIKDIYLYNNTLTILRKNLFSNLSNLNYIDLAHNAINTIEAGCFANVTSLKTVILLNNNLTTLHYNIIDDITKLNSFKLSKNPWHCGRDLCPIIETLPKETIFNLKCYTPVHVKEEPWYILIEGFISNDEITNLEEGNTYHLVCQYCNASKALWTFDGKPINGTSNTKILNNIINSTLILINVTKNDTGLYSCQSENCFGCRGHSSSSRTSRTKEISVTKKIPVTQEEQIKRDFVVLYSMTVIFLFFLLMIIISCIISNNYSKLCCRSKLRKKHQRKFSACYISLLHGDDPVPFIPPERDSIPGMHDDTSRYDNLNDRRGRRNQRSNHNTIIEEMTELFQIQET